MQTPDEFQADIIWDENQQPIAKKFDDVYFSRASGIDESRFVFLKHNALSERWEKLQPGELFILAETGFGTGLNFLSTWQAWVNYHSKKKPETPSGKLLFYSVEKHPLSHDDLKKSLALWPELQKYSEQLLYSYPPPEVRGTHKLSLSDNIELCLFFGDVEVGLREMLDISEPGLKVSKMQTSLGISKPQVNAWYLDGFAPAKNPDMWSPQVFQLMAKLSTENTTFSTFTCAGAVKRNLTKAGFIWEKVKGFGHKREMLCGNFQPDENSSPSNPAGDKNNSSASRKTTSPSWPLVKQHLPSTKIKTAMVIGGGLAGCHTAWALAQRGVNVCILEKEQELACGASGNQRGIIYTRLSPHTDALSRFNLHSLLFACHFYENTGFFDSAGEQCGVLHLVHSDKTRSHYKSLAAQFQRNERLLRWIPKKLSKQISNYELSEDGIFVPRAGYLNPSLLCLKLCEHKNIEVMYGADIREVKRKGTQWQAFGPAVEPLASADISVIANAVDAMGLQQSSFLPLNKIRGQVSIVPGNKAEKLSTALCGDGYVVKAGEKALCVGASFNLNSENKALSNHDHQENLLKLGVFSDEFTEISKSTLAKAMEGRVGFRCTSPDYFPIVGPVPQLPEFCHDYAFLKKKANAPQDLCGSYYPGLFTLLALGSRGLAYAPLAADTLASIVCGEPLPLSRQLYQHIHPARFLIRDLIRNKPTPELHS